MEFQTFSALDVPITRDEFAAISGISLREYHEDRKRKLIALNCMPSERVSQKFRYSNLVDLFEYMLIRKTLPDMLSIERRKEVAEFAADAILSIIEARPDYNLRVSQEEITNKFNWNELSAILGIRALGRISRADISSHICENIDITWSYAVDSVYNTLAKEVFECEAEY